ncbi:hypothetical protein [Schlesneria sp.]|uniref:hypothetical protein n=1 Tax=Schlesneria sp. TaxID=2762018 RepID=UPI002F108776
MLLGAQVAIFVVGILFLVRGKGLGKKGVAHPQYRWLGGFLITALPLTLVSGFLLGFAWGLTHMNQAPEQMNQDLTLPVFAMEAGIVLVYGIIASIWESSIRRKAANVSAGAV